MRVLVLGSAAGGGFPQWNCACANCRRVRSGDAEAIPRTQSSVAVSADGKRWFLLNASPDVREQIGHTPALHPSAGPRQSPLRGVVLTNGDVDHVAGLLTLRESAPLGVYASARVLQVLRENSIFKVLNSELVQRREIALGEPTPLREADGSPVGLDVIPFAVPGKVALYAEDAAAGPDFGTRPGDTIGLEVRAGHGEERFYYVPGCARVDATLSERLRGAPLVLFDGTLWRDDEMVAAGLGSKTGRRMGHISMSGPEGSIAAFAPLGVRRRVFVHINNTNPVLLEHSPERAAAEAAGWEVAYDGMEITL